MVSSGGGGLFKETNDKNLGFWVEKEKERKNADD